MTRGIAAIITITKQGGLLNHLYDSNYHNLITDYKMYDDVLQCCDEMASTEATHKTDTKKS